MAPNWSFLNQLNYSTVVGKETGLFIFISALPDNWFRFGSKLLKFFPKRKTWGQAQSICQALGGGLVSINSENEFMFEMFVKHRTNLTEPGFYASFLIRYKYK